ncbi:TonB-dependent receptor domain-containing protein [Alteromonas sp. 009811495]|uniref:TonB-dependent receptor domain-containing protein n=1 Tax=Alteromonas sp. 009811495 TaxID=3002962 RepID=UPI00237D836A|nr:TonB-dependent receptor [Alteromonas sp. 009811495]WDT87199.1 TonB-dependent receptor [Alteromonas sp. 009811495]
MGTHHKVSLAVLAALSSMSLATAEEAVADSEERIEEITVVGRSVSYANNATSEDMFKQQANLSSVLAAVDNLPGVLINEGDTFGADDWSTSIVIRGFQVNLNEQQIGMTVDGIANGNSNYGGGAKANRYIDTENVKGVEVSQGTADIASRSHEALGGTLNFTTIDPAMEQGLVTSVTAGEFDASKYYLRYETGEIFKDTFAWISLSSQESSDFMQQAAENTRDHVAMKIISTVNDVALTGYVSYDDTHEDNYQRIYGLAQYEQNPHWDQLTDEWTGVPYQDQAYRRGWSTLRENLFAYLQADFSVGAVDVTTNAYYHDNEGRGDWVPPYLVDVANDGDAGHSELINGNTVFGGAALGQFYFVDRAGNQLSPIEGCVSALTFPYGGAGAEYDPGCHEQGAIPVGSYRHTHYNKQRIGFNADAIWYTKIGEFDNTMRFGIWWEDYERDESRDWHKITNSAISYDFNQTPYWVQYDRSFPVDTLMYYIEDELDLEFARVRLGAKKFNVDIAKNDNFDASNDLDVNTDSDTLLSAGIVAPLPIEGLEVFAGYGENFAAIKDAQLERDDTDLRFIKPETADNIDVGFRYASPGFNASVTYYNIEFNDRIQFTSNETSAGIDFLEAAAGGYRNVGGIESSGIEISADVMLTDTLSLFTSVTVSESEYIATIGGTGTQYDTLADAQTAIADENNPESSLVAVEGNTVIGTPDTMAVVSLDWAKDNYFAGISTKYVDSRFLDIYNSAEVEDYIVSDLYIGGFVENLGQGIDELEVRLTVNNLFDEDYASTIAPGAFWIGAPRAVAVNARLTF